MKMLLLSLLIISSGLFSQAQTYPSSCAPSGLMEITYHNDACRLAIKRLHEINSPLVDSVTIPQLLIDSITKALYAVHNVQNVSVIDTIKQFFSYSNFTAGSDSTHIQSASNNLNDAFGLKEVAITIDNNVPWNTQWLAGNYNATTNASINYLVDRYQLVINKNSIQPFPSRTGYTINSPVAINTEALAKKFQSILGDGNGNAIASNSINNNNYGKVIRTIFTNDAINLSYTYGCGDCIMGCGYGRTWTFKVHTETDCSVSYTSVETWGFQFFWLDNPCLLYNEDTQMCPMGSKTIYSNAQQTGNTLQWQVSTDGTNFTNISNNSNYSGTNTRVLNLNNTPSSWYGNIYRVLTNGVADKITFNLKFVNTWAGGSNTDWGDAANWSCGSLPDANTDVIINFGNVILNADAIVRSVKVTAGATLTVKTGVTLTMLH